MSKQYKENYTVAINKVREILKRFEPYNIDPAVMITVIVSHAQEHPDEYIVECVTNSLQQFLKK